MQEREHGPSDVPTCFWICEEKKFTNKYSITYNYHNSVHYSSSCLHNVQNCDSSVNIASLQTHRNRTNFTAVG
jgi:hypothetical protein